MRGIIDPITLGFIIALFGATTAYLVKYYDIKPSTATDVEPIEFVVINDDPSDTMD